MFYAMRCRSTRSIRAACTSAPPAVKFTDHRTLATLGNRLCVIFPPSFQSKPKRCHDPALTSGHSKLSRKHRSRMKYLYAGGYSSRRAHRRGSKIVRVEPGTAKELANRDVLSHCVRDQLDRLDCTFRAAPLSFRVAWTLVLFGCRIRTARSGAREHSRRRWTR